MDVITMPTQFPDDCLPPERDYESRDALFKAINAWAAPRGYAFRTGRSHKEKSGRLTLTFTCDRACRPPNASIDRVRRTTTRGTSCEFSILAKQSLDATTWTVRHRSDRRFAVHNHEPSRHPSAHPIHRGLDDMEKSNIDNLVNAGVAPKEITTYIRQNSDSIATQRDIYNYIAQSRRNLRNGQSSILALSSQLSDEGFWSQLQVDPEGRVTAIIFAHPDSLAYLQAYPDLLLLDCTYKTNRYGMPLLDIVGVDSCQRSFCIAFAFLSGETEQDYLWALDRLKSLYEIGNTRLPSIILTDRDKACMNAVSLCFPTSISLLCRWHANKAVLRHCQSTFVRGNPGSEDHQQGLVSWNEFFNHWHSIMGSPDEETFNQRVQEFEKQYLPDYVAEVSYIKSTWLDLYKEKLVKAWVDQHPHFGNVVTSRVEGIHALVKDHLKTSTLDLFDAWKAMKRTLLNQLAELQSNQAQQQTRTPIELSGPFYQAVHGWVSHEALRKVEEQRKRLLAGDLPSCTGSFARSQGLPCAHVLKDLQEQGQALRLEHFHVHWHLSRNDTYQFLLEPRHRSDRIAARSTIPQSSTRREPSTFEVVEAAAQPRAQPKCSGCHTFGHRMNSKSCPLRHKELLQSSTIAALVATETTAVHTTADQTEVVHIASNRTTAVNAAEGHAAADQVALSQTAAVHEAAAHTASAETIVVRIPADQTASVETVAVNAAEGHTASHQTTAVHTTAVHAAADQTETPAAALVSELRYDDPRAIYQRYVAKREAWYRAQPRGSVKTNQQYRKAMGLPQRYGSTDFDWCRELTQMKRKCETQGGSREWEKEEMMAYLDWSNGEENRVLADVAAEMEGNMFSRRRGMDDIWEAAARDMEAQEALYSGR